MRVVRCYDWLATTSDPSMCFVCGQLRCVSFVQQTCKLSSPDCCTRPQNSLVFDPLTHPPPLPLLKRFAHVCCVTNCLVCTPTEPIVAHPFTHPLSLVDLSLFTSLCSHSSQSYFLFHRPRLTDARATAEVRARGQASSLRCEYACVHAPHTCAHRGHRVACP
jgi:hypothetical protein